MLGSHGDRYRREPLRQGAVYSRRWLRDRWGFTLIELLVTLAIALPVIASAYHVFVHQRRFHTIREHVGAMQQDARTGIDWMTRELLMAGYDPAGSAGAGFVSASAQTIQFSMDLNGDGATDDADEQVTYALYDADGDGDNDLGRDPGTGYQLLAENIQALAFEYVLDDGTATSTPADLSRIRAVRITLVARAAAPDARYAAQGGYRQQQLDATVQIRNMGL